MNGLTVLGGEDILVSVNGEKLPLAESISEETLCELVPICVFGENGIRQFAEKSRKYILKLVRLCDEPLPESFTLTVADGEKSLSYYDCRCEKRQRISGTGEPVKELFTIVSARREEAP